MVPSVALRLDAVVDVALREETVPESFDSPLQPARAEHSPESKDPLGQAEMILDSPRSIVRGLHHGVNEPEEGVEEVATANFLHDESVGLEDLAHRRAGEDVDVPSHMEPAGIDPLEVVLCVGARYHDTQPAFRSEDPPDLLDDPTGIVDVLDHLATDDAIEAGRSTRKICSVGA